MMVYSPNIAPEKKRVPESTTSKISQSEERLLSIILSILASLSFFAYLMNSNAVQYFLAQLKRLVTKFGL